MNTCVRTSLLLAVCFSCCHPSCLGTTGSETEVPLWQPLELSFEAATGQAHPVTMDFRVVFRGPNGEPRIMPGFWDGGSVWKARLTPDAEGEWNWTTKCSNLPALDGHTGTFTVIRAPSENLTHQHGGFLRVSANHRYLTYTDGTPFFWLGDTIWTFPTDSTVLEPDAESGVSMLGTILQTRKQQGYTVIQSGFIRGETGKIDRNDPLTWTSDGMDFWHRADQRVQAAVEAGFVIAMTSNWSQQVHDYPLDALMLKWRYLVARYAAYPVTWIVSGEYNVRRFGPETVDKVMVLGTYIKGLDPYKRAMTVHPWAVLMDDRQAWDAPWNDYIMIQAGHKLSPSVVMYHDAYRRVDTKPILESESDYEGMFEERTKADLVRHVAYRSIQNGSFGFTYGALGLWNAAPEPGDPGKWGLPTSWQEALAFEGGAQMRHLKDCYESVEWWKLEPRPGTAWPDEYGHVHVKASGDDVFVIYFEAGIDPELSINVSGKPGTGPLTGSYDAEWFNPRSGERSCWENRKALPTNWGGALVLPSRPDDHDWILFVRKNNSSE